MSRLRTSAPHPWRPPTRSTRQEERAAPGRAAFLARYRARFGTTPRSGHSLAAFAGADIVESTFTESAKTDYEECLACQ